MHLNVHSSTIYNSQDMVATLMPINRWMEKIAIYIYIYIYNEILLSHKKEWNTAICSNMDGSKEYYIQWNKLEKDKHYMIPLICGS